MAYKVGLTEEARNDLGAVVRFIAVEGANPEAGLRLGNELPRYRIVAGNHAAAWLAGAASSRHAETRSSPLADLLSSQRSRAVG